MRPDKPFQKMQRTKDGWGQDDFRTLYLGFGFGFVEAEGGKHRRYTHPKYPFLQATVGRHNSLAKGYAETAVALIRRLQEVEEAEETTDGKN